MKWSLNTIKKAFEKYFTPKTNSAYETLLFNRLHQEENESFEEFLNKIDSQVKKCDFRALEGRLLRDKIIIGIKCDKLREKLLIQILI